MGNPVIAGKRNAAEDLRRFAAYRDDPWLFMTECVFTKDQVDQKNPVKAYPAQWDYLRFYVKMWSRVRCIAVPKSRRMVMSWTNIPLYLWAAIFFPNQDFAFVSKKEEDAADLVRRAHFVFDHIPEEKIPRHLLPSLEDRAKPPALIFTFGDGAQSKIQGFPQGADQLRQFTFSGIFGDECAFWDEARRFYSASKPTTDGGGRMTLVSSRSPGFFQRVCYDALDHEEDFEDGIPDRAQYPLGDDSVAYWHNPKNDFHVIDLHYTANPNKRGQEFKKLKDSMPLKDWLVEYERNWDVYDGTPVFSDYAKSRHESRFPLEPHLGLPLLVGWDFGLTPAAVIAQYRDDILYVLKEFVAENKAIDRFAPLVMRELKQLFPEWADQQKDFRHFIDPAGFVESQVDQRTCAGEMTACGLRNIFPGFTNNAWAPRRKAVETFLIKHTKEGAGLQLYAAACPILAKGFAGGYRYPEKYQQIEPGKPAPIKNKYSHPHDALQYLCGGALSLQRRPAGIIIPSPQYSFLQERGVTQAAEESGGDNRAEYGIGGTHHG